MATLSSWRIGAGALLLLSTATPLARGETPVSASGAASTSDAKASVAGAPAAAMVRRDPSGRTGISPAREAIVRGDAALLARDFVAAAAAYQEAIKIEPQKPLGHLRMASLHLAQGDLDQAALVLVTAERFTAGDARATVQTLALKAMLAERRAQLADASLAWSAYALLGRAGSPAIGDELAVQATATTAADRKTVIAATIDRQAACAKVRERIEKEVASADANLASAPAK